MGRTAPRRTHPVAAASVQHSLSADGSTRAVDGAVIDPVRQLDVSLDLDPGRLIIIEGKEIYSTLKLIFELLWDNLPEVKMK